MTDDKFQKKLHRLEVRANQLKELDVVKNSMNKYKPKIQTTKVLMFFILCNCTVVELYSMWIMVYLRDLSPLSTLMGAVITESLSYAIYCTKSFKETQAEGNLQLDRDRLQFEVLNATDTNNDEVSLGQVDDESD